MHMQKEEATRREKRYKKTRARRKLQKRKK